MKREKQAMVHDANYSKLYGYGVICLLLTLFTASFSFAQSLEFLDDSYIYGDIVSFQVCNGPARVTYSCINQTPSFASWENGCSVYAFDSRNINCATPQINTEKSYVTQTHDVPINSYILPLKQFVKTIENETDAMHIAQQIYANSYLQNKTQLTPLMNKLRDLRDNTHKCWPADDCSLSLTTNILYLLERSGLNSSNRIYKDPVLWLEAAQTKETYTGWTAVIRADEGDSCEFRRGSSSFQSLALVDQDFDSVDLEIDTSSILNVTCDDEFELTLIDHEGTTILQADSKVVDSDLNNSDDYVAYNITAGCIPTGVKQYNSCDLSTTVKFLQLSQIGEDALELGQDYLADRVLSTNDIGMSLDVRANMLNNIYGYTIIEDDDSSDELYTWILYNQDNDGSFLQNETVTVEALRLLNKTNEWTSDARQWVRENVPYGGWNDIYADGSTYELFEPSTLPIRYDPNLASTSTNKIVLTFDETNVTSTSLTGESTEFFEVQSGADKVGIVLNAQKDGLYFATMAVNERLSVPITVTKSPSLTLEYPDTFYFIKDQATVSFVTRPTNSLTNCTFVFDAIFSPGSVNFSQSALLSVNYNIEENGEYSVVGSYECSSSFRDISDKFYVNIVKQDRPPIAVKLTGSGTDEKPYVLEVTNKLNRAVPVSLAWQSKVPTHVLPEVVTLEENQVAKVEIVQSQPTNLAMNTTELLFVQTLGYRTNVSVDLTIQETPEVMREGTVVIEDKLPAWIIISIIAGFAILLAFVAFIVINMQKPAPKGKTDEEQAKEQEAPKIVQSASAEKHAGGAVEVYIELQRKFGKTDEQIVAELIESGYDETEVKTVLADLNSVENALSAQEQEKLKAKQEAEAKKAAEEAAAKEPEKQASSMEQRLAELQKELFATSDKPSDDGSDKTSEKKE